MASSHHHLLLSAILFLLIITTTATSTSVIFSESPAIRSGTELIGGSLTLHFYRHCTLKLYDNGKLVKTFPVPIDIFGCTLYVDEFGVVYVRENFFHIAAIPVFGSQSRFGRYAVIVGNGKLGVYGDSIWSSKSFITTSTTTDQEDNSSLLSSGAAESSSMLMAEGSSVLFSDNTIPSENGDLTVVSSGDYSLVLESKCNLVVFMKSKNKKIWETNTRGERCQLTLRNDGELVLGEVAGSTFKRLWGSRVWSDAPHGHAAVLTGSGQLVIYPLKDTVYP